MSTQKYQITFVDSESSEDDDHISKITKHIFISSRFAINPMALENLGIDCVLSLGEENKLSKRKIGQNIKDYFCIEPLNDGDAKRMVEILPEACNIISTILENKYSVLVHCTQGISRSPTVVIAWLAQNSNMNIQESYNFVSKKHPYCNLHPSFIKLLCL